MLPEGAELDRDVRCLGGFVNLVVAHVSTKIARNEASNTVIHRELTKKQKARISERARIHRRSTA